MAFFRVKLGVVCIAGAIAIAVVGVACWYGRGNSTQAASSDGTGDTGNPSGQAGGRGDDFLPGTAPWTNLYLPKYTIPIHYDLTLYPDFYGDHAEFYGNVTIEIDVKQATQYLLVHIKYLNCKGKWYYNYYRQDVFIYSEPQGLKLTCFTYVNHLCFLVQTFPTICVGQTTPNIINALSHIWANTWLSRFSHGPGYYHSAT